MSSKVIRVEPIQPRKYCLQARYLDDSRLIFASDPEADEINKSIDHFSIDWVIVFDVDENLIIVDIEFMMPRHSWKEASPLDFASDADQADLRFPQESLDKRTLIPKDIVTTYDPERDIVQVVLDAEVFVHATTYSLGKNINALVKDGSLAGFSMHRVY